MRAAAAASRSAARHGPAYTPTVNDVGSTLRARVTATRAGTVGFVGLATDGRDHGRPDRAKGDDPARVTQPRQDRQERTGPGQGDLRRGVLRRGPGARNAEAGKGARTAPEDGDREGEGLRQSRGQEDPARQAHRQGAARHAPAQLAQAEPGRNVHRRSREQGQADPEGHAQAPHSSAPLTPCSRRGSIARDTHEEAGHAARARISRAAQCGRLPGARRRARRRGRCRVQLDSGRAGRDPRLLQQHGYRRAPRDRYRRKRHMPWR